MNDRNDQQAELAKIVAAEKAWQDSSLYQELNITPFSDEDKLKFHLYMKKLAQQLLGDNLNLDDENVVFMLSNDKRPNAALIHATQSQNLPMIIYISSALIEQCENKDQFGFIVGHELGHLIEQERLQDHRNHKVEEAKADLLAINKMAQAGLCIEEANTIATKFFTRNCYNVADEHVSDPNRIKMVADWVTVQRQQLMEKGCGDEGIIGDKKHAFEPDFEKLIKNRPAQDHPLESFFKSEAYVNANEHEKIDMWFEKAEEIYAQKNKQDSLALRILADEMRGKSCKDDYFWLKSIQSVFKEETAQVENKISFLEDICELGDFFPTDGKYPNIRPFLKEYFQGVREISDDDLRFNEYVEKYNAVGQMFGTYAEYMFARNVWGLDYSQKDVGKKFNVKFMERLELPLYRELVKQPFEKFKSGKFLYNDYGYMFLLDKEGRILIAEENPGKMKHQFYADQVNDLVTELEKRRNDYYADARAYYNHTNSVDEIACLDKAWKMLRPGVIQRGDFIHDFTGIDGIEHSGYDALKMLGFEVASTMSRGLHIDSLQEYLTPEAKTFWQERDTALSEEQKPYTAFVKKRLMEMVNRKDFYSFVHSAGLRPDLLGKSSDALFGNISIDAARFEDFEIALMKIGNYDIEREKVVCDAKLIEHLKAGKNLDDFELPFKEYWLQPVNPENERERDFKDRKRIFLGYEMLKENPVINLCDWQFSDSSGGYGRCPLEWGGIPHDVKKTVKERFEYNFNNPRNWIDTPQWKALGFAEDKTGISEVQAFVSASATNKCGPYHPYHLYNVALYFYEKATIQEKLETYGILHILAEKRPRDLPIEEQETLDKRYHDALKKDFDNHDLQYSDRLALLCLADRWHLFNHERQYYFELLAGKDGKGGLLKEIDDVSSSPADDYLQLLDNHNRIPDPDLRARVIKSAAYHLWQKFGAYDDVYGNEAEQKKFINYIKKFKGSEKFDTIPEIDQQQLLRELADLSNAQAELCDVIRPESMNFDSSNVLISAYGLEALTEMMHRGILNRNEVVEVFLGEATLENMEKLSQSFSSQARQRFGESSSDSLKRELTAEKLLAFRKEFEAAPLPAKAAILHIFMEGHDWENYFEKISTQLFQNSGAELGKIGKKFLHSYIAARPDSERCFYLMAIQAAANSQEMTISDQNSLYTAQERSLARGMRLFLENSGPAGVKLAQAMSSYQDVPAFLRDEMQLAKNQANPPARWTVFDWIKQTHSEQLLEQGKLGKLLGSASFFVTYQMHRPNQADKVVKILRNGSEILADREFKIYKEMLGVMKKEFVGIESFNRLVQNAADMVQVETNLSIGQKQASDAKKLYPQTVTADNMTFNIQVMDWVSHGDYFAVMNEAKGQNFNELPQNIKKTVAKAVFTTELANMLSGKRFDSDRHAGQYKFDLENHTIGVFDTGSMSIVEPTEKEKEVLGAVLANTAQAIRGEENLGAILCREIDKGIAHYYRDEINNGLPIPPYLSEFQRGLLALTDFHKEIPPKELALCLVQALNNNHHQLDPAIFKGFVSSMVHFSEAKDESTIKKVVKAAKMIENIKSEAMQPEARVAEKIGRIVFDAVCQKDNVDFYKMTVEQAIHLEDKRLLKVLDNKVGRIHFAKGMMKAVFNKYSPEYASAADKQQMGTLFHQVLETAVRQKKLKRPVSVIEIFMQKAAEFPDAGAYMQNIAKAVQVVSAQNVSDVDSVISLQNFKKAVVLGMLLDNDVRKGYQEALKKASASSFVTKTLRKIDVLSLVPAKAARYVAKFVLKEMAPAYLQIMDNAYAYHRDGFKKRINDRLHQGVKALKNLMVRNHKRVEK